MASTITRKLPPQWGTVHNHRDHAGQPRSKPPREWVQHWHFTHTSVRVLLFVHTIHVVHITFLWFQSWVLHHFWIHVCYVQNVQGECNVLSSLATSMDATGKVQPVCYTTISWGYTQRHIFLLGDSPNCLTAFYKFDDNGAQVACQENDVSF